MNKRFKKIVLGSLCLAIGAFAYLAIGFSTSAKYEIVNSKKAEDTGKTSNLTTAETKEIRVYNFEAVTQVHTCITDEAEAKQKVLDYFQTVQAWSELKPGVSIVYPSAVESGNVIKWDPYLIPSGDHAGEIYFCDEGPLKVYNMCRDNTSFDGYYYDAEYTDAVDKSTIQDVQHGWTFKRDANNCITEFSFTTIIYAKCTPDKVCTDNYSKIYTINYHMPDGTVTHKTHTYGEKVDLSEVTPTKEGWEFAGWYYDAAGTKKADGNNLTIDETYDADNCINGYGPVDLYPKFTQEKVCDENYDKTYKIHYDFELSEDQTVTYGTNSILHVVYKDGYTFDGWYFDKELTQKVGVGNSKEVDPKVTVNKDADGCIEGYGDITLYPKFIKNANCSVINGKAYYYDGDTLLKTIDIRSKADNDAGKVYYYQDGEIVDTKNIGEEINILDRISFDPFEKKGYKFEGWFADKELTAQVKNVKELTDYVEANLPIMVGTYIDEEGCTASNRNLYLYAKYSLDNPETGDSIYIYFGLGILLVAASGLTIKKIMNK